MRRGTSASLMVILLLGCAPSLRMVHQSDTYFEHCHGADLDPSLRVEQKHACWSAWLDHYAEGQPPDRVRYAEERCTALRAGEQLPPLPGSSSAAVSYTSSNLIIADGAMSQEPDGSEADGSEPAGSEPADSEPAGNEATPGTSEPASDTTTAGDPVQAPSETPSEATAGGEDVEAPDPDVVQPRRFPQVRYTPPSPPRMDESPCMSVCNPGWERCIGPCRQRGDACVVACEVEYRSCMNGCY